ncbi:hypothetical protein [Kordiimonas sp.]|uniref:hypothetical protein n=1 Tax=Kordiimonas sp. TaxID=1970157 RepID=UPI003A94DE37
MKVGTKLVIGTVLWLLTAGASQAQQVAAPPDLSVATDKANKPDMRAPEGLAELAFMIGNWDLSTTFVINGETTHTKARMQAWYTMGGFAVERLQIHPNGNAGEGVFVSTELFSVHPKTGEIVGVAQNNLGNRKFIEGKFIDGAFTTTVSGEMYEGAKIINRFVYSDVTPDSFSMRAEASDDEGLTWRDGGYHVRAVRTEP